MEQLAGDPVRAEAVLRPSIEAFERMGDTGFGFTHQMLLARALQEQGRNEEAAASRRAVSRRERIAPTRAGQGSTRASSRSSPPTKAATRRRCASARNAIAFGSKSDFLRDLGDRFVDLADIHALAGRRAEALAALARADELYERKGCVASLQSTAQRRAALA